ncbi:hypothetical protein F0P96_18825 [Hymenobacter busanensis]|uniref:Uncharacterized protein n=1 Tax=Hymenobacter busanensis TaxID=2607656 RepID=A0A7L4ZU47_9BACT|nr:hypothetical protein [Hymenobacter busanensis]KAA9325824.1 hypothetical protein F0P96_18825 [Hymenobacter busanensis]QHJ06336.1 hypothetical protein GUY19_03100 [Hymenobacter busanensis]
MSGRWVVGLWYCSLGAAVAAFGAIVVSYIWFDGALWLRGAELQGWTIYPPLSALPQAIPESENSNPFSFMMYVGTLSASAAAGVFSLLFWAVAFRGRLALREAGFSPALAWLPLLLLGPTVLHGASVVYRQYGNATKADQLTSERQVGNVYEVFGTGPMPDSVARNGANPTFPMPTDSLHTR